MGTVEQNKIKTEYYREAIRYMENAKETLKSFTDPTRQRLNYYFGSTVD